MLCATLQVRRRSGTPSSCVGALIVTRRLVRLLPERPPQSAASGRPPDLGRGDGVSAEDVSDHRRLRGSPGGRSDGRVHAGRRYRRSLTLGQSDRCISIDERRFCRDQRQSETVGSIGRAVLLAM